MTQIYITRVDHSGGPDGATTTITRESSPGGNADYLRYFSETVVTTYDIARTTFARFDNISSTGSGFGHWIIVGGPKTGKALGPVGAGEINVQNRDKDYGFKTDRIGPFSYGLGHVPELSICFDDGDPATDPSARGYNGSFAQYYARSGQTSYGSVAYWIHNFHDKDSTPPKGVHEVHRGGSSPETAPESSHKLMDHFDHAFNLGDAILKNGVFHLNGQTSFGQLLNYTAKPKPFPPTYSLAIRVQVDGNIWESPLFYVGPANG